MASPRKHDSDATKRAPTTGRPPIAIGLDCLGPLLNMPQPHAAQKLGISLTSLKMACTRLGVTWTVPDECSGTRVLIQSVRRRGTGSPTQLNPVRELSHTPQSISEERQAFIACNDSNHVATNATGVKPWSISSIKPMSTGSEYPAWARISKGQSLIASLFPALFTVATNCILLGLLSIQMFMRLALGPAVFLVDVCMSSHPPWAVSSSTESSVHLKDRRRPSTEDTWALEALSFDYEI